MRTYALVNNNTVTDIQDLNESDIPSVVLVNQLIIDVQDLIVLPQIGWVISGNKLAPPANQMVSLHTQIQSKIKHYQDSAGDLLSNLYATNTLNGLTTAQSDAMFTECAPILLRIREGAWPTAIYHLNNMTPTENITQQQINNWIALITVNL